MEYLEIYLVFLDQVSYRIDKATFYSFPSIITLQISNEGITFTFSQVTYVGTNPFLFTPFRR